MLNIHNKIYIFIRLSTNVQILSHFRVNQLAVRPFPKPWHGPIICLCSGRRWPKCGTTTGWARAPRPAVRLWSPGFFFDAKEGSLKRRAATGALWVGFPYGGGECIRRTLRMSNPAAAWDPGSSLFHLLYSLLPRLCVSS